jgi:hypothetical protein
MFSPGHDRLEADSHGVSAPRVFGAGLLVFVLAAWLARGTPPPQDGGEEGGRGDGGSPPLKPVPSGPDFDWAFYEDQFSEPLAPGSAPRQPTPGAA